MFLCAAEAAPAVQAALAADEAAEQAAQQASQQLEELKHQIDELVRGLLPDLEAVCGQAIWTGAALFVAAAFASEEALWLAMCLQVCSCSAWPLMSKTSECCPSL